MTQDKPVAQVPARSAVAAFTPVTEESLQSTAGGGTGPFLSFVITGTLLVGLSYWWIDVEDLAIPRDEPIRAVGGIVLLFLAFIAALALLQLLKALAGRRPWLSATLRLPPDRLLVGGQLRGELELSAPVAHDESAVIVLTCNTVDIGRDTNTTRLNWATELVVDGEACLPAPPARVPITMLIPSDAPPSGEYQVGFEKRRVRWDVTASIEPRRAVQVRFLVTVGSISPPTSMADEAPWRPEASTPVRPACSRVLKTVNREGGVEYRLPRPYGWVSTAWWVALTTPLWIVMPWMAWRDDRDWPGNLFWMVLILAIVNGLPLIAILGAKRLYVSSNGVVVTRRSFRKKRFHIRDLRGAVTTWGLTGPVVDNRRRSVALERLSGETIHLATFISIAEARWLAADIAGAIAEAKSVRDRQAASAAVAPS